VTRHANTHERLQNQRAVLERQQTGVVNTALGAQRTHIAHQLTHKRRTVQRTAPATALCRPTRRGTDHWHKISNHVSYTRIHCEVRFLDSHEIRTRQRVGAAGRRTVQQTGGRASHCSSLLLPPCSSLRPDARAHSQPVQAQQQPAGRLFLPVCLLTSHFTLATSNRRMAVQPPIMKRINQDPSDQTTVQSPIFTLKTLVITDCGLLRYNAVQFSKLLPYRRFSTSYSIPCCMWTFISPNRLCLSTRLNEVAFLNLWQAHSTSRWPLAS
jgi:hypothetical protein